jgi:uncharacterized protein YegP (UPF0339 family)
MKRSKLVIWKSTKNKQWYFTLKSGNGKIIATSEGYTTKTKAVQTAKRLGEIYALCLWVEQTENKTK